MNILEYSPHVLVSEQARQLPFFLCTLGIHMPQSPIFRHNGMMDCQLLFCLRGKGVVELQNGKQTVGPGDIFFAYPNEMHKYYGVGDDLWEVHWISFFGSAVFSIVPNQSCVYHTENMAAYEALLVAMEKKDPTADFSERSSLLYQLLLLCKRELFDANGTTVLSSQQRLVEVLRYMREHYAESVALRDLSSLLGVSDSQLCRIFQTAYNVRPMEYLNLLRVNNAKALLLRDKKAPVADIARAVGIDSPSYFTKIFHRYVGISPVGYRNLY